VATFSSLQAGSSAIGAIHYKTSIYSSGNLLTFEEIFAVTISNGSLLTFTLNINFQYTSSNYAFLSYSSTFSVEASGLSFIPNAIIVFDSYILLKIKGTNNSMAYDMEDH
jgi:hypothetical protein